MADEGLIKKMDASLPFAYRHPFALICSDGQLHLFWGALASDVKIWKDALAMYV